MTPCSFLEVFLILSLMSHLEDHLQSQKGTIWTFIIYYGEYHRNHTDVAMK